VGHSVGTQVVLEAYRLRPEGIFGLGLLCGSYGRVTYTFHGTQILANWLPDLIRFAIDHPKLLRAVWTRVPPRLAVRIAVATGEVNGSAVNEDDLEPYFEHLAHVDPGMFLRMLERAGEHSIEEFLGEVVVPTLVVAGDRDSFTPPDLSRFMAEALPASELVMIPGGTHIAPLENRDAVFDAMRSLLVRASVFGGFSAPHPGI
jgi:pimeloyl-ACP methyl ester carboxylesterase